MQVQDLYPAMKRLLMGRTLSNAFMVTYAQKGILELTENYKFQGLQTTGPTVQFTAYQANYNPQVFMKAADAAQNNVVNKINSFFM